MGEISLSVTRRVLEYATGDHAAEKQIAYTAPTSDIAPVLGAVSRTNQVTVKLGGLLTLVVGDRGAIWRAHNSQAVSDFDALFSLLANHSDQRMRFKCELLR